MVLTKGDDLPIHQTPEPIAYAGTDRNFYDRYFFNGYSPDGEDFFALSFGVYPHLDIADAHFSFIRDGIQYCIHASRELGMERMDLTVGPIKLEVLKPLNQIKVIIRETDGIAGEFVFTARSSPLEEPRFTRRIGPRTFMDYTRMTQNGHYKGWISLNGSKTIMRNGTLGTRDRSWGIRPIGIRDSQPIPGAPQPSFFWQWTPINFATGSLFFHVNSDSSGVAWNTRGAWVIDGAGQSQIIEGQGSMDTSLEPDTRWPSGGTLQLNIPSAPQDIALETSLRFQMKGLGYGHPEWAHGIHQGHSKVAREDIDLGKVNPLKIENLHVQMVVKAKTPKGQGVGTFEQLIIGPYEPLNI